MTASHAYWTGLLDMTTGKVYGKVSVHLHVGAGEHDHVCRDLLPHGHLPIGVWMGQVGVQCGIRLTFAVLHSAVGYGHS